MGHSGQEDLLSFLEEERRKFALFFSSAPRVVVHRLPKRYVMLLPALVIGIIVLLLVQHHNISMLQADKARLETQVAVLAVRAQVDQYLAQNQRLLDYVSARGDDLRDQQSVEPRSASSG